MALATRWLSFLSLWLVSGLCHGQELRGFWADTFHGGLRNATETSALVAAARAANCNALFVEVRKRGDAYYRNGLEPVATDVAAGFDPLADLIQKAHTDIEPIEVHAWIVTYNIWSSGTTAPSQPTHPYNLHPDWLTQNNVGTQFDGSNYQLDPGHPAVQLHTFNVANDLITRYAIDGLHFDYVRYSDSNSSNNSQPWGYNPIAVERFKKLKNRTGTPAITDSLWLQWRRDQVTALVRKVYLHAWAARPKVRISAALIAYGTAPPQNATLAQWQTTEAYARVLQDWRGWLEEGILDLGCPMAYRTSNDSFAGWANFIRERQYNRAAALGMGWYLNSVGTNIAQIKLARGTSAGGKTTSGLLGYSYAVPNLNGAVSQSNTWLAFTDDATAETYDAGGTPVFASPVATPTMPWKTNPTRGHLMGFVGTGPDTTFDGMTVSVTGPVNRALVADANGFFGSVDLPVGNYSISINQPGYTSVARSFAVTGATVTQQSTALQRLPFRITSAVRTPASNKLTIVWNSLPGRRYRIEGADTLGEWSLIISGLSATTGSSTYEWVVPALWSNRAFIRVVEEP